MKTGGIFLKGIFFFFFLGICDLRFPDGASGKEPTYQCRCERCGFDLWVRKTLEGGPGNPLQYSCLENPMDRKACWATVHGVAKSHTGLRQLAVGDL